MNKNIAKVVVGLPVDGPFDYCVKEELRDQIATGHRVHVLFNRRLRVGFVVGFKQRSTFKRLNTIIDILDQSPAIDSNALELAEELSIFYGCSWGEAIETSLPSTLRKKTKLEVSFIEPQPGSGNKKNLTTLIHDADGRKRWSYIIKQVKEFLKLRTYKFSGKGS